MGQRHAGELFHSLGSSIAASQAGLSLLHIASGDDRYPSDGGFGEIVDDCRALGIDALYTLSGGRRLLVAGQVYDDVYAVATLPESAQAVAVARDLQRRLTTISSFQPEEALLPASGADDLFVRWEWQISLVFGSRFAARLVESARSDASSGRVTAEGLERARRRLISATGGCIDFSDGSGSFTESR